MFPKFEKLGNSNNKWHKVNINIKIQLPSDYVYNLSQYINNKEYFLNYS